MSPTFVARGPTTLARWKHTWSRNCRGVFLQWVRHYCGRRARRRFPFCHAAKRQENMKIALLGTASLLLGLALNIALGLVQAAAQKQTVADVAAYQGPDRIQRLIAG